MGQFYLQRALSGARVLRKDIQDQRSAIDDLDLEVVLQVAQLGRGKLIVKEDDVQAQFLAQLAEFLHLARADVGGRVDAIQILVRPANDLQPRGIRELLEFIQGILEVKGRALAAHLNAHQIRAFARRGSVSGSLI